MKITKAQLKQIIKEEILKEKEDKGWVGVSLPFMPRKQAEKNNPDLMEEDEESKTEPIAGRDVPNEAVYPAIIAGFTDVLNNHLREQYNFYQELNNIAEYYAKNFEGGEQAEPKQAEPKEEEEDDFTDWEPESEYIERWAREQGIPEDEF